MAEENNTMTVPAAIPAESSSAAAGERLFTQEDVNRIVNDRLKREREKLGDVEALRRKVAELQEAAANAAPPAPTEAEEREKVLTLRENRLTCREYLIDNDYPAELLEAFDTSDPKLFRNKVETVSRLLMRKPVQVAPLRSSDPVLRDPTPEGFKTTKHTPRQFPPR